MSSTSIGADSSESAGYFFFFRFAVLRTGFFAADLVFALAFFAMLPS
jgi:hypothetical protein